MPPATGPTLSPCIGLCTMGGDGLCRGCLRTLQEIVAWPQMGDDARTALMERLSQRAPMPHDLHLLLPEYDLLKRALHPLDAPPAPRGWNDEQLEGLLPPGPPAPAAVLAGLVPRGTGTTVLLTRRHDELRQHGGQVSFPGGRLDAGDVDAVAAALRESAEEIALERAQVQPIGLLDTLTTISGFLVTPVVAVIHPGFVPVPNPGEVAEVFEVPLDYLMAPHNLRTVTLDLKGRPRTVLEYDWARQRIWGATAAILYNLRRRLEAIA
jgi:predicted Fe-S protein YdhL (DUF1289 family)/8-oxo-dGTP pyrophosphatase MutT (NUDIX family)